MKYTAVLILLLFSTSLLFSQKNSIRELRYSPEQILEHIKNGKQPVKLKPNSIDNFEEGSVSNKSFAESEVSAAINPLNSNNIIISPIAQTGQFPVPLYCPIYYTTNQGESWNESTFQTRPHSHDNYYVAGGGDPVLIFDNNGTAYLSWIYVFFSLEGASIDQIHSGMFYAYSEDGGRNWTTPDNYIKLESFDVTNPQLAILDLKRIADKQWMSMTDDNELNVTYTYIEQDIQAQEQSSNIIFNQKSKNGVFDKEIQINRNEYDLTQFSTSTVDALGNIHVNFFAGIDENFAMYYSTSEDGGNTFSEEKKISDVYMPSFIGNPGGSNDTVVGITNRRLYPSPYIAADNSKLSQYKNNIYVTWSSIGLDGNDGNGMEIFFTKSTDNGKNWITPKVINQDEKGLPVSQFYPSIAVNKNGVVILSYYDRSNSVNGDFDTEYVVCFSYDGGETFTKPTVVSTQTTDFRFVGQQNEGFGIGEYTQVIADSSYAYPVWVDGRNNNGNLNIYFAKVDISEATVVEVNPIAGRQIIKSVGPNPTLNTISINLSSNEFDRSILEIIDIKGQQLRSTYTNKNTNTYKFDISNLSSGTYFVKLSNDDGYSIKKFIKQ